MVTNAYLLTLVLSNCKRNSGQEFKKNIENSFEKKNTKIGTIFLIKIFYIYKPRSFEFWKVFTNSGKALTVPIYYFSHYF